MKSLKGLDLFETFNSILYVALAIMLIGLLTVDLGPVIAWIAS